MTGGGVIGYRLSKSLGIMVSHPIKVSWCAPSDQETKDSKTVNPGRQGIYKSQGPGPRGIRGEVSHRNSLH